MTLIEWSDKTWNPTVGCERCSPGCDSCYAIGVAGRQMQPAHVGLTQKDSAGRLDWTGEVRLLPDRLVTPLKWRKDYKVFVDSMSDLFEPSVPEEYIDEVFAVMAATKAQHRDHAFQILTKRTPRMVSYITAEHRHERVIDAANRLARDDRLGKRMYGVSEWLRYAFDAWPLPNVWLGTSVEDQQRARLRVPQLLKIDGWLLWLSIEPLIGPVELEDDWLAAELQAFGANGVKLFPRVEWVVIGGESGGSARPMHPEWARAIRDQCVKHDVRLLFKQWGQHVPWTDRSSVSIEQALLVHTDGRVVPRTHALQLPSVGRPLDLIDRGHPGWARMVKLRKKSKDRELDGVLWDEYPR